MIATLESGDPFGGVLIISDLAENIGIEDIARICGRRHQCLRTSGSDVVDNVNFYIQAMSCTEQELLDNGIAAEQVKSFVNGVLHIGVRMVDYITNCCPDMLPACEDLQDVIRFLTCWAPGGEAKELLQQMGPSPFQTLLQVLAGAPCLLCGHEEPSGNFPEEIEKDKVVRGEWIYLGNIIANMPGNSRVDVLKLFEELMHSQGMSQPCTLKVLDDGRSVLLRTTDGAKLPASTLQVLSQWSARQRGAAVYEGKMRWHAVLQRLKAGCLSRSSMVLAIRSTRRGASA